MTRFFDTETWKNIGQPDIGSRMFFTLKNNKKVFGTVNSIDYGSKKGIKISIIPNNRIK